MRENQQSEPHTLNVSGGFGGKGALGASAPPAESMVKKKLNLIVFLSMYGRYLIACSVSPV